MPLERDFKAKLIREIKALFPGAVVMKTDANQLQGIPDNLILFGPRWAMFEAKRSSSASHRPNQDHMVEYFNSMSFAKFVYPENKEEFLYELQQALRANERGSRLLKP